MLSIWPHLTDIQWLTIAVVVLGVGMLAELRKIARFLQSIHAMMFKRVYPDDESLN